MWEFLLEPYLHPSLSTQNITGLADNSWEFIKTVMAFCSLALLVPTFITFLLDKKRNEITASFIKKKATAKPHEKPNKLKDLNVTLQTIIDSLSDSIMVFDVDYNLLMVNKSARENFLDDVQDLTSLKCYNVNHNRDEPCVGPDHRCPIDEIVQTRKQCSIVHNHIKNDGSVMPVEIIASPILSESGDIAAVIESKRDISLRLAEDEARKKNDLRIKRQQRDQSIATLAGGIAHEFNNTLTSILGNAELLKVRLDDKDPNRKQTDAIIKGSNKLADLTSQLLAYAKSGRYQSKKILINKTVKDSLAFVQTGKFSSIGVHLSLAEDIWPVLGDPVQINQLVTNILINGFESLETVDGVLEIHTVNLQKTENWPCKHYKMMPLGDYVQLTVTNTGTEIPAEHIDKIFDPFFSTKFTGRGLGLAAAKGIVQNHNGCIYVDSSPTGTTFNILLPKALVDQEVVSRVTDPDINFKGLKVLAVDDDPQVLAVIENLLTHHGCHVLTADKGIEALELIDRHKDDLDLVVLDIQMPGVSGAEVYRKLKVLNPGIRVLISSGHEEYTALQNIELDARVDRYIKKPFSMVELLQKIKEIVLLE